MGYLDNTTVTVEAILTKKGRELLSKGGTLNITKFALADDEVDYSLWQADHPLGTNYYGTIIENMPVLEATPDETQIMRFKLVTLPKTTTKMPIMTIGYSAIVLGKEGDEVLIQPRTRFYENDVSGYTAIVENSNYVDLQVKSTVNASLVPVIPSFLRDSELNQSIVKVGNSFTVVTKDVSAYTSTFVKTNITIIGNDTGATMTVPITVYTNKVLGKDTTTSDS